MNRKFFPFSHCQILDPWECQRFPKRFLLEDGRKIHYSDEYFENNSICEILLKMTINLASFYFLKNKPPRESFRFLKILRRFLAIGYLNLFCCHGEMVLTVRILDRKCEKITINLLNSNTDTYGPLRESFQHLEDSLLMTLLHLGCLGFHTHPIPPV